MLSHNRSERCTANLSELLVSIMLNWCGITVRASTCVLQDRTTGYALHCQRIQVASELPNKADLRRRMSEKEVLSSFHNLSNA